MRLQEYESAPAVAIRTPGGRNIAAPSKLQPTQSWAVCGQSRIDHKEYEPSAARLSPSTSSRMENTDLKTFVCICRDIAWGEPHLLQTATLG